MENSTGYDQMLVIQMMTCSNCKIMIQGDISSLFFSQEDMETGAQVMHANGVIQQKALCTSPVLVIFWNYALVNREILKPKAIAPPSGPIHFPQCKVCE